MKKLMMIIIPLVLALGGAFGAAKMGMIQIPGITPKKKGATAMYGSDKDAAAMYGNDKDKAPVVKAEEPPKVANKPPVEEKKEPEFELDPVQGRKKLAKLWNAMDVDKLTAIATDWKDEDLAPQFLVMDPEKVALLLGKLDAKRASKISKLMQEEASKVIPQT